MRVNLTIKNLTKFMFFFFLPWENFKNISLKKKIKISKIYEKNIYT